ncbi:DnaB-like helicase N-terminal domain-containing protein [Micromonospora sp. NBC_00421]|uniref:DnaB-like helicase N-terminal domain-containing protein n=1 Tax=Micromonospora sp. NBC_00421 TaxID=2975976 RepID=UPI002E1F7D83
MTNANFPNADPTLIEGGPLRPSTQVGSGVGEVANIPQHVAERWLIGAMLRSRLAITRASWIVDASTFSPMHGPIANLIFVLNAQRRLVTPESVADALASSGKLTADNGVEYLRELVAKAPKLINPGSQIDEWATCLADKAFARQMQAGAEMLLRECLLGNRQRIAATFAHIHACMSENLGIDHRADWTFIKARDQGSTVTALYRWFDADGTLLYIGITNDPHVRQSAHAKKSSWADFAVRGTIERFPSRQEAEAAEKAAIEAERPLFNHIYNDTTEARARLVAYLIEHGRMDLLAPAVSRG